MSVLVTERSIRRCNDEEKDELVPDPTVAREFEKSLMSLWRWDHDEFQIKNGWPPPIKIWNRKFRSRKALETFKANMTAMALTARGAK